MQKKAVVTVAVTAAPNNPRAFLAIADTRTIIVNVLYARPE